MKHVEFYYDFSSPNAYFASVQLPALAERVRATVTWRPFLLGAVFKTLGTPTAPLMNTPQKAAHTMKDLARWSERYEVPFQFPSRFPMNTVKALRSALAVESEGGDPEPFVHGTFEAYWTRDLDISDATVLAQLLEAAGHDATHILGKTSDDAIKAALKAATDAALARGVFGTPTFIVGDELFFGKDRLDFVEAALRKA